MARNQTRLIEKAAALSVGLLLVLGTAGCTTGRPLYVELPLPPSESVRAQMERVVLVQLVGPAVLQADMPLSKQEAAERYGQESFTECLVGAAGAGQGAILVLAIMPVVVGGNLVFGSVAGISDTELRHAAGVLQRSLNSLTATATLQQTVMDKLQPSAAGTFVAQTTMVLSNQSQRLVYTAADFANAQSVVEIGPVQIQLVGEPGPNPPLQLVGQLPVRVVRLADGAELYAGHGLYHGPQLKFLEWAQDGGERWQHQINRALEQLATLVGQQLYQVRHTETVPLVPRQMTGTKSRLFGRYQTEITMLVAGPWPVDPPLATALHRRGTDSLQAWFTWPTLPAEQVRLSWEPAPEAAGPAAARYDLCVWRGRRGFPAQLVYEVHGLAEPAHTLTKPLVPDQEYFWSVRVRHQEQGRTRLSAWAHIVDPLPPGTQRYINFNHPDPRFFRFHTR